MIYAIRAGEFVKIGYTSDSAETRIRAMQTGCPFELTIAAFGPGERALEWQYHFRLKREGVHVRGEWFKSCKETDWVIDKIRERGNEFERQRQEDGQWRDEIPSLGHNTARLDRILQYVSNVAGCLPKRRSRPTNSTEALQPDQAPA